MLRGEIWWAKLPPPVGRRPVLLLSRNEAYAVRNAITVAEVTATIPIGQKFRGESRAEVLFLRGVQAEKIYGAVLR